MPATDSRARPTCTRTGATYYGLLLYQVFLQPAKDILDGNQGCGVSARDGGFPLQWATDRRASIDWTARNQTRANPRPGRMPGRRSRLVTSRYIRPDIGGDGGHAQTHPCEAADDYDLPRPSGMSPRPVSVSGKPMASRVRRAAVRRDSKAETTPLRSEVAAEPRSKYRI